MAHDLVLTAVEGGNALSAFRAAGLLERVRAVVPGIAQAVLSPRHRGAGHDDYLAITLTDVLVTAVQVSQSTETGAEEVNLSYRSMDASYRPQDLSGSLGSPVTFGWDTTTGTVT